VSVPEGYVGRLNAAGGYDGPPVLRGLDRMRVRLAQLRGWRRIVTAILLGALAVLALPPLYVVPALIPAFTGFAWLLESDSRARTALASGFWFGMGYFTAGLYWVANALLTKPDEFGWFAPAAPVGLALLLAPTVAFAAWLARLLAPRPGAGFVLALAASWTLMEWVRSFWLTGFPWNLIGSVWTFADPMIQVTALIGTYGLGLLTVAAAAMPAEVVRARKREWLAWPFCVALLVLALIYAGGALRLALAPPAATVEGVRLRLVQPNIPQNLKWRRDLVNRHIEQQVAMGAAPAAQPPTHVIWSEASAPTFLADDPRHLAMIGAATPPGGLTILGTLRQSPPGEPLKLANSLLAIDHQGRIVDSYDKSHLVPFGEYMPLREIIPLPSVAAGMADFAPGPGVHTMRLAGLPPVSPLICYEVIFPAAVADTADRPAWMLNLTNDGWYGQSAGPYQHFAAARLRAVEEGLPLVRVANTGISAIVDAYGRVTGRLGLGEQGVLDGDLPAALTQPTPYARWGNLLVFALIALFSIIGARLSRRT
jgi:apolipoprotein N-acyltransferase